LAQLKILPVDTVKIDRGFVHELGIDHDDLAIVQSIVGLAESFGLYVVAEGVDSARAARILLDLGCRFAQGFLFSPPVQPDQIAAMLGAGRRSPTHVLQP
jgi:EAL domain-containing protein (putative c-di-GMP-specific phosphodiesterase class I)